MARTLKQQIRKIIKQHYGDDLWTFRADVNYGAATESFVKALSRVIKGEIEYSSDWECDLAKYGGHTEPLDINIGNRVRCIRLQKGIFLEDVASNMGVHPDYLNDFEQGKVVTQWSKFEDIMRLLNANHEDWQFVLTSLKNKAATQDWVKHVIELYYGKSLWTFRPQFGYEESIAPFVQALVDLDQNQQLTKEPLPILPTLSEMIEIEERRRKNMSNPVTQQKVRKTLKAHY